MPIDDVTKSEIIEAIFESNEIEKKLNGSKITNAGLIDDIAIRTSTSSSAYLAATIGGVFGAWLGVFLFEELSILSGPSGMLLGACAAVLSWRGPAMRRHEQAGVNLDAAMKRINAAISSLPENAPPEDRAELYDTRRNLLSSYGDIAKKAILASKKSTVQESIIEIIKNKMKNIF